MKLKLLALALACVTGSSQATLVNNSDGTVTNTTRNTMWLQDANLAASMGLGVAGIGSPSNTGGMDWSTANLWIAALNTAQFGGYSDWRLPTARNSDGTLTCIGLAADKANCQGSEFGQLYYDELSNALFTGFVNDGPFTILPNTWWTSEYLTGGLLPVALGFQNGTNYSFTPDSRDLSVWAVRDCGAAGCGDGNGGGGHHVPEPGSAALAGLALLGLFGVRRRLPAQPR